MRINEILLTFARGLLEFTAAILACGLIFMAVGYIAEGREFWSPHFTRFLLVMAASFIACGVMFAASFIPWNGGYHQ